MVLMAMLNAMSMVAQKRTISKADEAGRNLQYQEAIAGYLKAWDKMKDNSYSKQQLAFNLAECYRIVNNPAQAAEWYAKLADTKFAEKKILVWLNYASELRTLGKCEEAVKYYEKYLQKQPGDFLAMAGLESCRQFADTSTLQSRYIVRNMGVLNSADDDYSPAQASRKADQLFFSTNRKGTAGKDRENWTGAWFADIFTSGLEKGSWKTPVSADMTGMVNSFANEGTPVFDKKFHTMFFTRCEKGVDEKVYCKIMESDRQGQRWSKPAVVVAESRANIGHPWISTNELTIIFASDRKGGQGGKDLWMSTRAGKNKPFKDFENLGSVINTPGDEMFPNLENDSTLYFASSGHPGLGGLDIFRSVRCDGTWSKPENLLAPINSTGDDFGFFLTDERHGFFSSNRSGGKGGDDIYGFEAKTVFFTLSGVVRNENTLFSIPGIPVIIVNSRGDSAKTVTGPDGAYGFDASLIKADNLYRITIPGGTYFAVRDSLSTMRLHENSDFVKNFNLVPVPEEPVVLPDILYDLDKWDLKPMYQDSLLTLVKILNDNPNFIIELRSHTDSRASNEYNDELSQKRAQSVVDFLISKKIDPGRLVAKGYGKRIPRKLEKEMKSGSYKFSKGTVLNDAYIEKLPSKDIREAAYALNRRTEFLITGKDYRQTTVTFADVRPEISIVNDSAGISVPYRLVDKGIIEVQVSINDYSVDAKIDTTVLESFISAARVIELLQKGALSKADFEGDASALLANNKVADSAVIKIRKLRIGDLPVEDVTLTVLNNMPVNVKMGRDILEVAGQYRVDAENKKIIFK